MKKTFNKINLCDGAKQRIIEKCISETIPHRSVVRVQMKYVVVTAILLIVSIATVLSIGAATDVFKFTLRNENKPHVSKENQYIESEHSVINKDGYVLNCNGIAGDTEHVFFDLTLVHKENKPIAELEENVQIDSYNLFDSYLMFSDGHQMDVYCTLLPDSTEYKLHFELYALFLNKDKPYLGQKAELFIGGINIQVSSPNGNRTVICKFQDSIDLNIIVDDTVRTVDFEPNEFEILNGGIKIKRGEITATCTLFYGDCYIEGPIYELCSVLCEAYLIYDGRHVPLGVKTIGGSINNEFVIGWWNETVIDPDKITGIYIEGKTIAID